MKKFTKVLASVIATMLMFTMMIGCGGPKVTPPESAKIVLDILLKGDNSQIATVGITQEEFDEARETLETGMETSLGQAGGSFLSEESKKALLEGILEGMSKMEYTTELVSEEKETAIVKVKIKSFDMTAIQNQLQTDVTNYVQENPTVTQKELMDYTFKKEAELLKAGTFKSEPTEINITLTSDGKVWTPNESDFTAIGNSLLAK